MKYTVQTVICGAYQENAYLICPKDSEQALLIDPGDGLRELQRALEKSERKLAAILLTHGHFDHILAAEPLAAQTGAALYAHAMECPALNDMHMNAYVPEVSSLPYPRSLQAQPLKETFEFCGIRFEVLHTPGHTPGSVCYYDAENAMLFSGDTLFCAGYGRCDLPGGSMMQMRSSLRTLFALPENVRVFPGHGDETSIGMEKARYRL